MSWCTPHRVSQLTQVWGFAFVLCITGSTALRDPAWGDEGWLRCVCCSTELSPGLLGGWGLHLEAVWHRWQFHCASRISMAAKALCQCGRSSLFSVFIQFDGKLSEVFKPLAVLKPRKQRTSLCNVHTTVLLHLLNSHLKNTALPLYSLQEKAKRETTFNQGCFVFAEYQSIQAVQAAMILSTIFCCVAFLVFILQLFRLKQGERFVLTSIIQLLSCEWFFNAFDFNDIFVKVGKREKVSKRTSCMRTL